jgi:hypothetical protein
MLDADETFLGNNHHGTFVARKDKRSFAVQERQRSPRAATALSFYSHLLSEDSSTTIYRKGDLLGNATKATT